MRLPNNQLFWKEIPFIVEINFSAKLRFSFYLGDNYETSNQNFVEKQLSGVIDLSEP